MKEIKFRVWDKCFEEMAEVVSLDWSRGDVFVLDKDLKITDVKDFSEVVLMQYTGLKDKNGVEIYEGDIVGMHYFYESKSMAGAIESEGNVIGVVGIDKIGTYTETEDEKHYWLIYLEEPEEELEVLGNIHENPELLEEKQ